MAGWVGERVVFGGRGQRAPLPTDHKMLCLLLVIPRSSHKQLEDYSIVVTPLSRTTFPQMLRRLRDASCSTRSQPPLTPPMEPARIDVSWPRCEVTGSGLLPRVAHLLSGIPALRASHPRLGTAAVTPSSVRAHACVEEGA